MTKTSKTILAVSVAVTVLWSANAEAKQVNIVHMPVSGRTSQPIGHYEYCKRHRADCNLRSINTRPVKLSRKSWRDLDEVNQASNLSVRPVTDLDYYNTEEYWTYPKRFGDCEDYVLMKRKMLMQRGWPASSLLITVVRQPNGDGHAVLTVRTDKADFVLDNLRNRILPWQKTEYRFLKRQSATNSGRWEGIEDYRSGIVGSVR